MYISKLFLLCTSLLFLNAQVQAQEPCNERTSMALQMLPSLLDSNDFQRILAVADSVEAHCGSTELTQRLKIVVALILQEPSAKLIQDYQRQQLDEKLVQRFDYANHEHFEKHYQERASQFEYVPLGHPVDSLIALKTNALLQSDRYQLNRQEEAICLLFSGHIEPYYELTNRRPPARPLVDQVRDREQHKERTAAVLYAGAFFPIGSNEYLKTSPTFGFTFMGPLHQSFVFELGLKMRINTKNAPFDFRDDGQIKEINASTSYYIGANLGYKAFDNGPFIILPKVGLGLGFINTKLAKTTIYDSMIDYEDTGSGIQYNNANTLHSVAGIAFMRHIKKKMYIGLELNYHVVPYNWDKDLITRINDQFSSVELFLRF